MTTEELRKMLYDMEDQNLYLTGTLLECGGCHSQQLELIEESTWIVNDTDVTTDDDPIVNDILGGLQQGVYQSHQYTLRCCDCGWKSTP